MPAAERLASDGMIRRMASGMPEFRRAQRLFVFVGDGWEVDTRPLIEEALSAGKQVALPLCPPEERGTMEARLIRSLDELRQSPPLWLWEPAPTAPLLQPEDIDLALIPCIACDRSGQRLGRGGGYYDRFLRQARLHGAGFTKAALCRQALLRDELPTEAHDEAVDMVVTEAAVCQCR
jgi:5-formyltetrahydrofolate cyclo-ligase